MFVDDNIYNGLYLGCLPNVTDELLTDYPNSYGYIDRSGSLFVANTNTDNYMFQHVSGTTFLVDAKGNLKIQVANNQVNMNGTAENPKRKKGIYHKARPCAVRCAQKRELRGVGGRIRGDHGRVRQRQDDAS